MNNLFRKKTLDKISSPEQLNDYIRVTKPSVWLTLLAVLLLLFGMLAWNILGTVEVVNSKGQTETVHPLTFITN